MYLPSTQSIKAKPMVAVQTQLLIPSVRLCGIGILLLDVSHRKYSELLFIVVTALLE